MASDEGTEHYVQLISNASLDVYPDNVISEFSTQLAEPLRLHGDWKVGMHSCSYHKNWANLKTEEDCKMSFALGNFEGATGVINWFSTFTSHIPFPGNYSTVESLIKVIGDLSVSYTTPRTTNYIEIKLRDVVSFEFNPSTQKMTVRHKRHSDVNNDVVRLELSPRLCWILGMNLPIEDRDPPMNQGWIILGSPDDYNPQLPANYPFIGPYQRGIFKPSYTFPDPVVLFSTVNFFVYTDIVKKTLLGDASAEYIHMVPVEGADGAYVNYEPTNIIYKPVTQSTIRTIWIKVADHFGNRVSFMTGSGAFTCLLHFKRVVG